jgi:GT2 family glycosyltransferase
MPPRVSVVIPNWNTGRFLPPCLSSLREQTFEDFETIVTDSGSTDGSVQMVRERFPEVRVVELGENRGFSAAVNAGIAASDAELIAPLNNDTEQEPDWLAALVRAADGHHEAGFFASKMVDFEDRNVLDGAGDALRLSGLPYRLGHGERDRGQFDKPNYVFGACAGAALYRRAMLEDIGGFDEDFFMYCEDGDLSFRAQLAGYRCLYVPDAVVYHVGSASTGGKRSPTATRLGTRNSLSLLVKDLPLYLVPHVLPFFVLGQMTRLVTVSLSGRAVLKAHLEGLSGALVHLPLMLRKRRKVQAHRRVSGPEIQRLIRESSFAATASLARRLRDLALSKAGR